MSNQKYISLMKSVSEFGKNAGLNTDGLYKLEHNSANPDIWLISVSSKHNLNSDDILYPCMDQFKKNFDQRLSFPIINGTKEEISSFKKIVKEKGAESFSKKSIACDGLIQPSPEFLKLNQIEQVGYALHEAYHNTPKEVFGEGQDHILPEYEEACASIIEYLGAIHYFENTSFEKNAVTHWNKNFNLAKIVNKYYTKLEEIFRFRANTNGDSITLEQKAKEREEILNKAKYELKDNLGNPINNAFFIYWNHFYNKLEIMYNKVKNMDNFKDIVKAMTTIDRWD